MSQSQCDPLAQSWMVKSSEDTASLAEALNCTGGAFSVDWIGHVFVEKTIYMLDDTSLTITGADLRAVVDGGGTTALFDVENATLQVADIQLINAYKDGLGAAVYASTNGVIELGGTIVFANNHAGGGTDVWSGVEAMFVQYSTVTWRENVSFINNTVDKYDGGDISVYRSMVNANGVTEFVNKSASEDCRAVRIMESDMVIQVLLTTAR